MAKKAALASKWPSWMPTGDALKAIPWIGAIIALLTTLAVLWPLSDIREHTKEIAKLSSIPQAIEKADARLSDSISRLGTKVDAIDKSVAKLEAIQPKMADIEAKARSAFESSEKAVAAANITSVKADQLLAEVKAEVSAFQEQAKEFQGLSSKVMEIDKSVSGVRLAVKALEGDAHRSRITVAIPLSKPTTVREGPGAIRGLQYDIPFAAMPTLLGKDESSGVRIEHVELDRQPTERTEGVVTTQGEILWNQSKISITVWSPGTDRLMEEFANRGARAMVIMSYTDDR